MVAPRVAAPIAPQSRRPRRTRPARRYLPTTASAVLAALAGLLTLATPETLRRAEEDPPPARVDCATPFAALKIVFSAPLLSRLCASFVVLQVALTSYTLMVFYLTAKYGFTSVENGAFISLVGLSVAVFQGACLPRLVPRRISNERGVIYGSVGQVLFFVALAAAPSGNVVFLALLCAPSLGLIDPCLRAIFSSLVDDGAQGNLQGALQALRSLTHASAALFSCLFALGRRRNVPELPFLFAALLAAVAGAAFAYHLGRGPPAYKDPKPTGAVEIVAQTPPDSDPAAARGALV